MTSILTNGVIYGPTAFTIFHKLSEIENNCLLKINFEFEVIWLKLNSEEFDQYLDSKRERFGRIKKISNCKLQFKNKYFLIKDMPGITTDFSKIQLMIDSMPMEVNLENIIDVEVNVLLEPLLNLIKCQSINEALMNWSLNGQFMSFQVYIDHSKLIKTNIISIQHSKLEKKMRWFLSNENIKKFVPKKFLTKVQYIQKSKKNNLSIIKFLDVVVNVNKHFISMVRKYYTKEQISNLSRYNLDFPIELFGNKDEILDVSARKSLYLVRKSDDYLHLKSFAVLFNLRWFFNTRYNSKKSLGFNGEYGRTITGYGQTFHKYDDVLLWLTTHPNTIEDVEFVILDPIPSHYIFDF
jgi:hypothetical protein